MIISKSLQDHLTFSEKIYPVKKAIKALFSIPDFCPYKFLLHTIFRYRDSHKKNYHSDFSHAYHRSKPHAISESVDLN